MRTVAFLTGTRADFGKLSSLVAITRDTPGFRARILATGMHLEARYGRTVHEIEKAGFGDLLDTVRNHAGEGRMDEVLARTVAGVGAWLARVRPDLLVVHGDRVEAIAGTLAASLQGVRVAHVEGGELSGTIDEHLRHAITKLSHLHLVSNDAARARLLQLGEHPDTIHVLGSPEVDAMTRPDRPGLAEALAHYGLPFRDYGIVAFHPVTTELDTIRTQAEAVVGAALDSGENLVVVYPNSDEGNEAILEAMAPLRDRPHVRIFPSIRFQYMLALLENARFVLGNSSMGVREAPFFGTPALDVGTRQQGRSHNPHVLHLAADLHVLCEAITRVAGTRFPATSEFGDGRADERFRALLQDGAPWAVPVQKRFVDAHASEAATSVSWGGGGTLRNASPASLPTTPAGPRPRADTLDTGGSGALAVITARGGSKGLPGKHLRLLGGEPLLAWTVRAARAARRVARVIVTSDDPAILDLAATLGAETLLRPAELARDDTPSDPVVVHAVREAGHGEAVVVLLQPTSPLRTAEDIDAALAHLDASGADAVVSVCAPRENPWKSFYVDADGCLRGIAGDAAPFQPRQSLPVAVRPNGAIYGVRTACLLRTGRLFAERTVGWEMPRERSVDIDTAEDLAEAEEALHAGPTSRTMP